MRGWWKYIDIDQPKSPRRRAASSLRCALASLALRAVVALVVLRRIRAPRRRRSCASPSSSPRPTSIRPFVSDLYSHNIIHEIFEPPLTYDFLARPAKLKPADRRGDARDHRRRPHLHDAG